MQFVGFLEIEGNLGQEVMDYNCQGREIHSVSHKSNRVQISCQVSSVSQPGHCPSVLCCAHPQSPRMEFRKMRPSHSPSQNKHACRMQRICMCLYFRVRVLCSRGCPLVFDPPVSKSQVLGSQACSAIPPWECFEILKLLSHSPSKLTLVTS